MVLREPGGLRLPLYFAHRAGLAPADLELVVLNALEDDGWQSLLATYGTAFPGAFPGVDLPEADGEAYAAEKGLHQNQKWGNALLSPVASGRPRGRAMRRSAPRSAAASPSLAKPSTA